MDISRLSSLSVGIFTWLLQYFPQNRVISVQKLGAEKKIVKIRFRLGKPQKKVPPLMARPFFETLFLFCCHLKIKIILL